MKLFLFLLLALVSIVAASDVCKMELVTGPCRAAFRRYGYSTAEGKCKEFIYGGCQGNDNNFETLDDCKKKCP